MKKRIIFVTVLVVLLALVLPLVPNMVRYRTHPLDAALMLLMDETQWAPGFSDAKFRALPLGSSANEVRAALGEPLTTNGPHGEGAIVWYYTTGPNGQPMSSADGSTHVRACSFDDDMTLKGKSSYFYVD